MQSSQVSARTLARLKSALQRLEITQEQVAAEASKTSRRGSVGHTAVSRTFAGRSKSANILAAAKRLIAERRASTNGKASAA